MQRWSPHQNPQRCLCCNSHVTPEFRRGYGDEQDRAHRCLECDTISRIDKGSVAGRDVDLVDPLEQPARFGNGDDDRPPSVKAL